jgi:hypothetical protein
MTSLPRSADLLRAAARVVWFEPPERALADPVRFLAYVMTYATAEEIAVVRRYVELDDFREALEHAPAGIMDERSWAYWNVLTGRYPVPPMPRRVIPQAIERRRTIAVPAAAPQRTLTRCATSGLMHRSNLRPVFGDLVRHKLRGLIRAAPLSGAPPSTAARLSARPGRSTKRL